MAVQMTEVGAALAERARVIIKMGKAGLDLSWLQKYRTDSLIACCDRVAENLQSPRVFKQSVQRELIERPGFAAFYAELTAAFLEEVEVKGIQPAHLFDRLDSLLEVCEKYGHDMALYGVKAVTDILNIPALHEYGRLILLENFNLAELTEDVRDNVVRSVGHCCDLPLMLSDKEKAFLQESFVGYSDLTGYAPFAEVFELLENSPSLMEIARLLQEKDVEENLVLADYRIFAESLTEYTSHLSSIIGALEPLPLEMFLEYWKANGCLLHELQTMNRLLNADPDRDWPTLLGSHSAYTNTLYGMKFKNLDWTALGRMQEGVIIYAISHNKKHFIRLVDENFDLFLGLPDNSILFRKELYEEYFNINELTKKTLEQFKDMPTYKFHLDSLEPGRVYSFQELKALSGKERVYWTFYHHLHSSSQDYRLLVFRQICKKELLMGLNDNEISALAAALDEKPIHSWRQEDFGHIRFLCLRDTVQMLLHREELQHLIPVMQCQGDVTIALRSLDAARQFDSIDALKEGLLQSDEHWLALSEEMNLTPEFVRQYREPILAFLCRDGASVAQTYAGCLDDKHRDAFLRVVKAELMGKLHELKYFADDLQRELDMAISDKVEAGWKKCLSVTSQGVTAEERDDFFSTMFAGTEPQQTCLSYINGTYRKCLLSGFDSNKKLIKATMSGKIVGRAFLRLTKASLEGKNNTASFTFADLDSPDEAMYQKQKIENVVLFLERPYISGVDPKVKKHIIEMFHQLALNKAREMGVDLVLSWDYHQYAPEGFTQTRLNLYISKSKAGSQYLDSLDGQATVATEGSYRANTFLVRQAEGAGDSVL